MADDDKDAAIWLQNDAAYLYRCADAARAAGDAWLASRVQDNAAHSAKLARERMGMESAGWVFSRAAASSRARVRSSG